MVIFLFSVFTVLYCFYRCYREREEGEGAGEVTGDPTGGDQNNNFATPEGVPEDVNTPMLLMLHYYFNSMFSLARATAHRWFPTVPDLEVDPVQEIELGVV